MQLPRTSLKIPTGLSFDIPELLMIQGWADFHDLRLTIELDVVAGPDEYEEVIGLFYGTSEFRRWMMWRTVDGIVVQPMMGRPMLFDTMTDALDTLIPVQD